MTAPLTRLAARLGAPNSDPDLLTRFVQDRDEAAFAALVNRHGPTVFGVCRRVLGNSADAEDAFQAVFLVLVNRADSLTGRAALGDWLYAVAVRVALKARTAFARLRKRERIIAERRTEAISEQFPTESWFDRELSALPDKFREPVVLCLIQDRPRAEVAAELGIPEGTLASRLDTARKRLADRLARYRVPLVLTGLVVPVPAALADTVVGRVSDGAGVAIHLLATEVTKSMTTHTKWLVLAAAGVLAATVGGLLIAAPGPTDRNAKRNAPVPEKKEPKWKQEFDKIYSLKDDELVKIIPRAERPDCRKEFERERLLTKYRVKPEDLDEEIRRYEPGLCFVFRTNEKGKVTEVLDSGGSVKFVEDGRTEYPGVMAKVWLGQVLPIQKCLFVRDSGESLFSHGPTEIKQGEWLDYPDVVVRSATPTEKLVPALDKALAEKVNAGFRVEWKQVEREVWVASGTVELKPRAWRKAGQVDVYSNEKNVDKEEPPQSDGSRDTANVSGGVTEFLDDLSRTLVAHLIWHDDSPPKEPRFQWSYHWDRRVGPVNTEADRDPEKVLPNVAEQTGLTFKKEKRKVPMLVVSERK